MSGLSGYPDCVTVKNNCVPVFIRNSMSIGKNLFILIIHHHTFLKKNRGVCVNQCDSKEQPCAVEFIPRTLLLVRMFFPFTLSSMILWEL